MVSLDLPKYEEPKMIDFFPSSDMTRNTNQYLQHFSLENNNFFFKKYFSQRKNRIKITGKSTLYTYDKVRNDYFINLRYGLKTFLNLNSGIVTNMIKETKKFPLVSTSLYQRRFKDLSIFQKHLLYKSNQDFRYRNIALKIKPLKNIINVLNPSLLTKPLNKRLYFNLLLAKKNFSLSSNVFFLKRFWKKNWIQFLTLGFYFLLKNNSKKNKKIVLLNLKLTKKRNNSKGRFSFFLRNSLLTKKRKNKFLRKFIQKDYKKKFLLKKMKKNIKLFKLGRNSPKKINIKKNFINFFIKLKKKNNLLRLSNKNNNYYKKQKILIKKKKIFKKLKKKLKIFSTSMTFSEFYKLRLIKKPSKSNKNIIQIRKKFQSSLKLLLNVFCEIRKKNILRKSKIENKIFI